MCCRNTEGNICEGKWGGRQRRVQEPSEGGAGVTTVRENRKGRKVALVQFGILEFQSSVTKFRISQKRPHS